MKCAWDALLGILPPPYRVQVDKLGRENLQEIRMRLGSQPVLICKNGNVAMTGLVTKEQLDFVINTASHYSPWSVATMAQGYLTVSGGHRIGVCGEAVVKDGQVTAFRRIHSLCIRIARDLVGVSAGSAVPGESLLILGPPGSGKTTFLRDMIRRISDMQQGSVAVVDERGEIFPPNAGFATGKFTDVLTGAPKPQGLMMALRTMGPGWIAVDEVTAQADCDALIEAAWCGVKLLATVHAAGKSDLFGRKIYEPLLKCGIFRNLIVLQQDKSFRLERSV